jgi:hypothetical protein
VMRIKLLVVVMAIAAAGWFVRSPSWVRPAALAVFAIAVAALLWGRSSGSARGKQPTVPQEPAERPEAAKEMWDALDRGEDPTSR